MVAQRCGGEVVWWPRGVGEKGDPKMWGWSKDMWRLGGGSDVGGGVVARMKGWVVAQMWEEGGGSDGGVAQMWEEGGGSDGGVAQMWEEGGGYDGGVAQMWEGGWWL